MRIPWRQKPGSGLETPLLKTEVLGVDLSIWMSTMGFCTSRKRRGFFFSFLFLNVAVRVGSVGGESLDWCRYSDCPHRTWSKARCSCTPSVRIQKRGLKNTGQRYKNSEHKSSVFAMNLSEGKAAGGTPPCVWFKKSARVKSSRRSSSSST